MFTVTHAKVSAIADAGDASLVQPSDWNAGHTIAPIAPEEQTAASYTFDINDANKTTVFNSASAQTATIPPNSSVAFPVGTRLWGFRRGAGLVTFAAGAGVTLLLPTGIKPNRFMGAQAKKSADQTTANFTTAAPIPFDAEDYDTDGFHDNVTNNSRLTIPSGLGISKIMLNGCVIQTLGTAADFSLIGFGKNGSQLFIGNNGMGCELAITNKFVSTASVCAATSADYFELFLQNETDTSTTIMSDRTNFSVTVVEINPVGSITYQNGSVGWEKIDTNVWRPFDLSGLG